MFSILCVKNNLQILLRNKKYILAYNSKTRHVQQCILVLGKIHVFPDCPHVCIVDCNTTGHCFLTWHLFQECNKIWSPQFFFIIFFNLPTDRLHQKGLPQIRHAKDQPTMA